MKTPQNRSSDSVNESSTNEIVQQKTGNESTAQFTDRRSVAQRQNALQKLANNSPRVKQLNAIQKLADNRLKAKRPGAVEGTNSSPIVQASQAHQNPTNTLTFGSNQTLQRLVDVNVPRDTPIYVSNAASPYFGYKGKVLGPSQNENMLNVTVSDPDNWRSRAQAVDISINDLVQLPDRYSAPHNDSIADATKSQLTGIGEGDFAEENRGIVEGRFTGRKTEEGSIDTTANPESIGLLREEVLVFVQRANALAEKVKAGQRNAGMFLNLYRGMHSPTMYARKPGDTFTEPLPFSTTFNKSFARKWSQTDKEHESVILKLQLPINFPMIFLSSPAWLGDFGILGNQIVNQGQQEVTVAPMTFKILNEHIEDDHKVFDVVAEKPLSENEVSGLFNSAVIESQIILEQRERALEETQQMIDEYERRIAAEEQEMQDYEAELDYEEDLTSEWQGRMNSTKKGKQNHR